VAFIRLISDDEATGEAAALFAADLAEDGYVANMTRLFARRPDVLAGWVHLLTAIRDGMDRRRYELVTVAAARRLRSSSCMLAHGQVLAEQFLEPAAVRAIALDHRSAGLDPVDVAVMDLAGKVVDDAISVTQEDVDRLRDLGLADDEVFDVVAAAAVRCFLTKTLDALGVQPDSAFGGLEPTELRDALVVGRPIASS
jgi:uncharacterized peroxidase-related enzyme